MNRKQRRATRSIELSKAAASPVEYEFRGQSYLLSPLNLSDWGRVEAKMKQLVRAEYLSDLGPDTDDQTRKLVVGMAHEAAAKINVLTMGDADATAQRTLQSPEVVMTVLHCSLKHEQPDATVDEIRSWFGLTDIDEMMAMFTAVMHLCGFDGEPDEPESTSGNGKGAAKKATDFPLGGPVPGDDGRHGGDAGAGEPSDTGAGVDAGGETSEG